MNKGLESGQLLQGRPEADQTSIIPDVVAKQPPEGIDFTPFRF
ncbi:MAG: hypothetical protein AAGH88_10165 [Planctomycetota bacterium]